MKRLVDGALRLLTWLAVLWTIYEEQHHLALYLGDREIAFGIGEYVDIAVTLLLIGYAVYEVFHFFHRTRALNDLLGAHPALELLNLVLLAALAWGIYRDISHFRHIVLVANGALPLDDEADDAAALFLALGALKTGYHTLHAAAALRRLGRSL